MSSEMPSRFSFMKPVLIISFVALTTLINEPVGAASSVEGNVVSCYDTEMYCKANCTQKCYYVDSCNNSHRGMYACAPNIILIVAIIVGVLLLVLLICCVTCCCCPCCILAQCLKRKKELRQSRLVIPAAQPLPPTDPNYQNGYPMRHNIQEPPAYIQEDLTKF